jgi:hypothetical protein
MSKNLISIAAALSLAAFLPACQSSGTSGASPSTTASADKCTKAKNDGARNTPIGQATIKLSCNPSIGYNGYMKEIARQDKCVAETGRICSN